MAVAVRPLVIGLMSRRYSNHFEILDIRGNSDDYSKLAAIVSPSGRGDASSERLLSLVHSHAHSVIIETDYIDTDYRAGYARFYYLRHHDTDRRCIRLHFFRDEIGLDDLLELPQSKRDSYLGFAVVRPLPAFVMGRSLLSIDFASVCQDSASTAYVTATAKFFANVAGNEIEFDATPWMEQDTQVSACASAAIWVASYCLAHRYAPDYRAYSTPEITDLASTAYSFQRPMPSEGLTLEQILGGLQKMGYDPVLFANQDTRDASRICYRYIESGLPVILGVALANGENLPNGHALTVVGHEFKPDEPPVIEPFAIDNSTRFDFCRSSDFAKAFIVQDDRGGPFRRLEFIDWQDAVNAGLLNESVKDRFSKRYSSVAVFDRGASNQEISFLSALIVPLPSGIALGGFMAERNAATLFAAWHKQLNVPPVPQPLLRTYLQPSNRLKARLTADTGLPAEFRRELRSHLMPKWVWVTEYADRSEFLSNGTCVGLLIADSASHPTCSDFMDIVALHVPGSLCLVGTNASVLPRIVSVPATVGIPILRRDPCCS